ncbi:MAG: endonuclease MutS2, partial [Cyclobacteriaceae bacterium]
AVLRRAKIEGSYLSEEEAFELRSTLNSYSEATTSIKTEEGLLKVSLLCEGIAISNHCIYELNSVIDDKGKVSELVSSELKKVRQQLISESGQVRKQIGSILKNAQKEGWTQDGIEPTIRNGRLVIPLYAEYKRKVRGLIHDVSGTGQTVYLEPASVVDMNNRIVELAQQEKLIIIGILQKLTATIREELEEIKEGIQFLYALDSLQARALFGQLINGVVPHFQPEPTVDWTDAFHPLLYLSLKEQKRKVESFSFELNEEQRIIIISGPNAGGKSVSLKATGLIQYLFQCGLPVPMEEESTMGWFDNIIVDIGDDQSIEDDLSTYSGHLKNMGYLLANANERTLCLIDEFGTGTDPSFGGAIAEGILSEVDKTKARCIITTHYENIKQYADENEGIVNASMQYDVAELRPLYKLQVGQPGSSYTMQIAQNMKLPQVVLDYASTKVGTKKIDYEKLITELETEKYQLNLQAAETAKKEKNLQQITDEYEELKKYLAQEKRKVIKKAEREAAAIVDDANKLVEKTIRTIKESQADKEKTKSIRKELDTVRNKWGGDEDRAVVQKDNTVVSLSVGDIVKTKQGTKGEIVSIDGKNAKLAMGNLTCVVKLQELTKLGSIPKEKQTQKIKAKLVNHESAASMQVDIRGKRADEVNQELDSFLNKALIDGFDQIRVLHGKGHGVLRTMTRNYLKGLSFVDRYENEAVEAGGDGITVVYLK